MAISIIQNPANVSLSQSPVVFAVSESSAEVLTSSSVQYVAELYYFSGSETNSGSSADYTLVKFPNESKTGIFDVSRVLTSTFTDLLAAESSSVKYFAIDSYVQYKTSPSSSFFTGSRVKSSTYKSIDGYSLFQETVTQEIQNKSDFWPIMTDGPVSQSYFDSNGGRMGVWVGSNGGETIPNRIKYVDDSGTGYYTLPTTTGTTQTQIADFPIGNQESDFPLSGSNGTFTIQAQNGVTDLGSPITFTYECTKKYPNVRIKWKNRYGQFDYFNFNLVSTETFNTKRSRYQPQIGSWADRTLTYQGYESSIQNYITDSTLKLQVNTDYVSEDYNDIFKQLMVSDEIYWVYDESNESVRPLAIDSTRFNIKTHVVDKLIQYSFDFTQGQGYKLIF